MGKPIIDDELWALIEPLLPPAKPRRFKYPGRKPVPDRAALTGILFVLKTGIRWRDLPAEMGCGSGVSCWRRLRDWQQAGVWDRLHALLLAKLRAAEKIDISRVVVDSSSIRAVGAGEKMARTPPIERDPIPNTTSPPTPTARPSRQS
jgi:transposase